jgi:hypothetical protein
MGNRDCLAWIARREEGAYFPYVTDDRRSDPG